MNRSGNPGANISGNMATTRLIRRMGDRSIMGIGQAITLTGLVLLLALDFTGLQTPLFLALPLAVLGFGHGQLVPPTLTGTVDLLPALAGSAAAAGGLDAAADRRPRRFPVGLVPHEGPVNLGQMMLAFAALGAAAQVILLSVVPRRA